MLHPPSERIALPEQLRTDDDFRRLLVNLFVNSVTVWEEDYHFKVIAYNLSSIDEKTYHLKRVDRQSDFNYNACGLR